MSLFKLNSLANHSLRTIDIFKKNDMNEYKVHYYTFLDAVCNDYTIINKNFIELSKTQNFFILTSGNINGINYDQYLKDHGVYGHYIHSDINSFPVKFNKLKKYLDENKESYENSIFCKIDTDFVHYKVKSFHKLITSELSSNKKYFIGNVKNSWIRGALNAIHIDSILLCPMLNEKRWDDFDVIFTKTLCDNNLIEKKNIELFEKSHTILTDKFGTHVSTINKIKDVLSLNDQLNKIFPDIYE